MHSLRRRWGCTQRRRRLELCCAQRGRRLEQRRRAQRRRRLEQRRAAQRRRRVQQRRRRRLQQRRGPHRQRGSCRFGGGRRTAVGTFTSGSSFEVEGAPQRRPRHAYRSPRALAVLPEEAGHMRSCTVLIRQRKRGTCGLVPRALAPPEEAGHMRSCTGLAWVALSANGRRMRDVEFLLPTVSSLLQQPHVQTDVLIAYRLLAATKTTYSSHRVLIAYRLLAATTTTYSSRRVLIAYRLLAATTTTR